jgi:hypothetical protein
VRDDWSSTILLPLVLYAVAATALGSVTMARRDVA